MPTLMTQSEYADHRGVSQATVSNYLKLGKIPKSCQSAVEIDGRTYKKIDAEKADAALDQNLDVRKQRDVRIGPGGKGPAQRQLPKEIPEEIKAGMAAKSDMPMHEAQRLGEIYKTLLLEQKFKIEKGLLCPKIEFEVVLKTCAITTRNAIQAAPAQVKFKLAQESDPDECERILNKVLHRAFVGAIPKEYHKLLEIE